MFKLHVKPSPTLFFFFHFAGVERRREGKVRKSEKPYKDFINKTSKYHDRSVVRVLIKEKKYLYKDTFCFDSPSNFTHLKFPKSSLEIFANKEKQLTS